MVEPKPSWRRLSPKYTGNETCSAFSCNNTRKACPRKTFFRFPRDKIRCRMWLKNCKRKDLLKVRRKYLYSVHRVCEDHFEQRMFINNLRNRLHHNAVPTIFEITTMENIIEDKDKIYEIDSELRPLLNETLINSEDDKANVSIDSDIIRNALNMNSNMIKSEPTNIIVLDDDDKQDVLERKWCAAINCEHEVTTPPEGICFFKFPQSYEMCKKWAMHCRRTDLMNISSNYLHNNFVLCSLHFNSSEFIDSDKKILKTDAIPKFENTTPLYSQL